NDLSGGKEPLSRFLIALSASRGGPQTIFIDEKWQRYFRRGGTLRGGSRHGERISWRIFFSLRGPVQFLPARARPHRSYPPASCPSPGSAATAPDPCAPFSALEPRAWL